MQELLDSRPYRVACIVLFAALLSAPMLGRVFELGTDVKWIDGHYPEPRPPLPSTLAELASFPTSADIHMNESFGFRAPLVSGHNLIHLALGVSGSPLFMVGREGWFFHREVNDVLDQVRGVDRFTPEQLESWVRTMEERQRWLEERGIEFLLIIPPNKHTIYPEYLPPWVNRVASTRYDQLLVRLGRGSSLNFIDLRAALLSAKSELPLYLRTDGHWNELGGFVAYREIVEWIRERHPEIESFERDELKLWWETRGFGTIVTRLNLIDFVQEDMPHLEPEADSRVYDTEKLGYGASWVGSYVIKMKTHNAHMPKVLFIRDSFANRIALFLSEHMSETILVHHRNGLFGKSFIDLHQPDIVIYEMVERQLNRELYDSE